jgi:multiple sugar transport system substrate-binding protein
MNYIHKFRHWKFLVFLLIILITGCGKKETPSDETADTITVGETEITWWAFPVFAQENSGDKAGTYERKIIAAFEKENPDIQVKLSMLDYTNGPERLSLALQNNEACDVLLDAPGRIIAYGQQGYLASLDDMFTSEFTQDIDNEELANACRSSDTAYMYPLSSAPFYMAFNRDMLEQAGVLDLVKEGWTTEDFTQVLTALHESGYVPGSIFCNGTGGDQGTRAFVANLFDSTVMNESLTQYTLGNEQGIHALDYIKSCVDDGLILNGSLLNGTDAIENFVYGRASFSILWGPSQQNSYADLMNTYGVDTVEVPLPSEDGESALEYLVNGFCIMDSKDEKKIEASKRFLQFLCDDPEWGPKNVTRTGCIPVRSSFGNLYQGDIRMEDIAKWTQYYIPYYNTVKGFASMREAWSDTLYDVLENYSTPEDALADFEETSNQSLQ